LVASKKKKVLPGEALCCEQHMAEHGGSGKANHCQGKKRKCRWDVAASDCWPGTLPWKVFLLKRVKL